MSACCGNNYKLQVIGIWFYDPNECAMVAGLLQRITAACAGQPDIAPMPVRNTCLGIDLPVRLLVLWSYHCLVPKSF